MTDAQLPKGRATIYAVAQRAGVSIATVSRVISSPDKVAARTREKVEAAIAALNYVPDGAARSLAVRRHGAFGLVLPELRGSYYADLLFGFESAVSERGISVLLLLTLGKPHADLEVRRLAGRVDALALHGGVEVPVPTVAAVARKVPVVGFAVDRLDGVESYGTQNLDTSCELTEHLLAEHGCRRLRFVGSPELAPDVQARYAGFVQAHEQHGLQASPPVPAELEEADGERVAGLVLEGGLAADGLVCANDELALALLRALTAAGVRVPEELVITGWDDEKAARYIHPGLTTVRQPIRELGALAAERLHALVDDPAAPAPTVALATSLVPRGSCGC